MKKRVKLLTTIASLCLAVALMAFGVYAANAAVTFKTNSTVSFSAATEVIGEFTATLTKYTAEDDEGQVVDSINAKNTIDNKTWVVTDSDTTLMGAGYALGGAEALKLVNVGDKYEFSFTFKNNSPYAVNYELTLTDADKLVDTKQANAEAVAIDVEKTQTPSDAEGSLGLSGTITYTVTIELKSLDIATNVDYAVNYSLSVVKPEA